MIMECRHVWSYISDYLDDSLSSETVDLVKRHLEHCGDMLRDSRFDT
jgi:hypothetical protein